MHHRTWSHTAHVDPRRASMCQCVLGWETGDVLVEANHTVRCGFGRWRCPFQNVCRTVWTDKGKRPGMAGKGLPKIIITQQLRCHGCQDFRSRGGRLARWLH